MNTSDKSRRQGKRLIDICPEAVSSMREFRERNNISVLPPSENPDNPAPSRTPMVRVMPRQTNPPAESLLADDGAILARELVNVAKSIDMNEARKIVDHLDDLSELLAKTEKMTIYHGFKGGVSMPFEEAKKQLMYINEVGTKIQEDLMKIEKHGDMVNIINLCIMYSNRIIENNKKLFEITEKLYQFSNGGKKYGFFEFRKDKKEWTLSTKKLLNVHSNVHLFLRGKNA